MMNIVRKNRYSSTAITFLIAFVALALTMQRDLNIFDEGIILTNVMLVQAGEVIHRDFYALYGPAQFYVLAALFHLGPAQFLIERIYGLAVMAGVVTLTFTSLDGRVRRSIAIATTIVCGLLIFASPIYLYPLFPCLVLALGGSLLLVPPDAIMKAKPVALAGACAGLSAYFRYDAGFFLLASNIAAIAILLLMRLGGRAFLKPAICAGFIYSAAAAIIFLPGAIAFMTVAPLSAFWTDVFEYSTKYYAVMRGLPFPGLRQLYWSVDLVNVYLPLFAAAAAGFELWRRRGEDRQGDAIQSCLVLFAVLAIGMYYKGTVRVSPLHFLMSIVPGMILLALCADAWWTRGGGVARLGAVGAMLLVAIPTTYAALLEVKKDLADPDRWIAGWLLEPGAAPDVAHGCPQTVHMWPARLSLDYLAVANYLRSHTRPDERVWVGLDRHDKIFANPEALQFAAQRLPGTRWHEFDPGMQNRADMQPRMIDELRRRDIRWLIRDSSFGDVVEPNGSRFSTNVFLLDRYLDAEYRQVAAAGRVTIWLKKGVTAPVIAPGARCMPVPTAMPARPTAPA